MKKSLFGFVALAAMLGATSCSQDADLKVDGKGGNVTFKVNVAELVGTRAVADGKGATTLVAQVYNTALTEQVADPFTTTVTDLTAEEEVFFNLPTGVGYKFAFFAYNEGFTGYNVDDLRNVTINYDNAENNSQAMDAFFANYTVDNLTEAISEEITLTRPFAQVNVGVLAENNDFGITSSSATVDSYYTQINLFDGTVGGEVIEPLTFKMAGVPSDSQLILTNGTTYDYLSTTYLLVGEESDVVDMEFAFEGNGKNYTLEYESVPVKRNNRTNILTAQDLVKAAFNITVDPNINNYEEDLNGELEEGSAQEPAETVSVSNVTANVEDGNVIFGATYTGTAEITSAYFVCTPNTREAAQKFEATVQGTSLSKTVPTTELTAGNYTVTVEINGETATVEGEAAAPSITISEAGGDEPSQPGEPVTVTYTCTALGTETLSSLSDIEVGDVKFSFSKGSGQTAPSYNKAGDIRLYAKNVITVSGKNCTITKLEFTLDNTQLGNLTPSVGTISGLSTGATTASWEGDSNNFTLTVGEKADYGSDTTKAGQFRFKSVTVTYIPD